MTLVVFECAGPLEVRAQQSDPEASMEALRKQFGGSGERPSNQNYGRKLLVVFLGTILIVGGGATLLYHLFEKRKGNTYESPRGLFRELAKIHGMNWAERRFLRGLAREIGLANPLEIFVEPRHLAWALYNAKFAQKVKMIRSLEVRFFGEETDLDEEDHGFIASWLSGRVPGLDTMLTKGEQANADTGDEFDDPERTDIWRPRDRDVKNDRRDTDDNEGRSRGIGPAMSGGASGPKNGSYPGSRNVSLKAVAHEDFPTVRPQESTKESPKRPQRLPIFRCENSARLLPESMVDLGRELTILERILFTGVEEKSGNSPPKEDREEDAGERSLRKLESAMSNAPARPLFIG